jgi:hypothetical protein
MSPDYTGITLACPACPMADTRASALTARPLRAPRSHPGLLRGGTEILRGPRLHRSLSRGKGFSANGSFAGCSCSYPGQGVTFYGLGIGSDRKPPAWRRPAVWHRAFDAAAPAPAETGRYVCESAPLADSSCAPSAAWQLTRGVPGQGLWQRNSGHVRLPPRRSASAGTASCEPPLGAAGFRRSPPAERAGR